MIFQGILTSIANKPYIFVIFQVGPDPLHPLWIRAWENAIYIVSGVLIIKQQAFDLILSLKCADWCNSHGDQDEYT